MSYQLAVLYGGLLQAIGVILYYGYFAFNWFHLILECDLYPFD